MIIKMRAKHWLCHFRSGTWSILYLKTKFLLVYCGFFPITVNLDAGDDGKNEECGRVLNLMAGNETTLTASGKVPFGDCKVAFRAISNSKYKCNQLCVTLRNKKMMTCDVKILFTAIYFSKQPDEIRVNKIDL